MKRCALQMLAVVGAVLAPMPAMAAFQCPAVDTTGGSPALGPADFATADGAVGPAVTSAIRRMRAAGLKSGAIVDKLVVADCRRLDAGSPLSDADKAREVRRFAAKLATFIYTGPGQNEEDIVLDVAVPTALYGRLQRAAHAAGVSEDAWVDTAIMARLGKP